MRNSDLIRLSLHNLFLHKIRSFLTSLGIIFGVGSVIAMLAISEGAKATALKQIEAMGIDKILVSSEEPLPEGQNVNQSSQNSMLMEFGLKQRDLRHVQRMENVKSIATVRHTRERVLKGTTQLDVRLVGVSTNLKDTANLVMRSGRWLTEVDNLNKMPVCVIGKNVRRKYFSLGVLNVIGETIRVGEAVFRIVGVADHTADATLGSIAPYNDLIFIPERTSEAFFGFRAREAGNRRAPIKYIEYDLFLVTVMDIASIHHTTKRIEAYLSKLHRKKDWKTFVPFELFKQKEQTQKIFTVVMASIAGISLIVGGVGIMNIMLANIYERRKEIGTRRAIGATRHNILAQFLVETVFLTTMGGLLGIALGVGISELVTRYADWPTVYSPMNMVLAMGISSFVGVLFGTYPAMKAANQNPIDVLRAD